MYALVPVRACVCVCVCVCVLGGVRQENCLAVSPLTRLPPQSTCFPKTLFPMETCCLIKAEPLLWDPGTPEVGLRQLLNAQYGCSSDMPAPQRRRDGSRGEGSGTNQAAYVQEPHSVISQQIPQDNNNGYFAERVWGGWGGNGGGEARRERKRKKEGKRSSQRDRVQKLETVVSFT